MNSILSKRQKEGKVLTEDDIPMMRHEFMFCYGWISDEEWSNIPLPTIFEMWEFVMEEKRKREEFRLLTLRYYGIKNPK